MLRLSFMGFLLWMGVLSPVLGAELRQTWTVKPTQMGSEPLEIEVTCLTPSSAAVQNLVLWLPSEYGYPAGVRLQAQKLAQHSHSQVCLPNLFEAYFLPTAPSSIDKIPASVIWALTEKLQSLQPSKPLYVLAEDKGAVLAIRGWHWRQQQQALHHKGLILLNPNLYIATPIPGEKAQYLPEVSQINAPIFILQAELSPWRWHLRNLAETLTKGGSPVWLQLLPKVRDRFYFRPDALPNEQQQAKQLPAQLTQAMEALKADMSKNRVLQQTEASVSPKAVKNQKKSGLVPYKGPQNIPLRLQSLQGKRMDLADYRGQVVLLNFWASWCPPCVHEMPSMVALKNQLKGQPFEILAVNLGEPKPAIQAFLKQHPVNFPVLLDPTGQAVKNWRIFAYPSSFLIDQKGHIRYALFGGYDWTQPQAVKLIRQLMAEKP